MRLIDADAFDKELYIQQRKYEFDERWIGYKIFDAIRIDLSRRPTIDAAPVVHGKWVMMGGMKPPEYHHHHQCSVCESYAPMRMPYGTREVLSPFCPTCGAKMDLE